MKRLAFGSLLLVSLTACGPTSPADKTQDAGSLDGIGAAGGKVEAAGSSVDVPANALDAELAIAIEALPAQQTSSLAALEVEGLDGLGEPSSPFFAFTPHGTQFSSPVTIRLPYTGSGAHVLRLDDEDDTSWETVPDVTFADGVASFQTTRFSVLVVVPCQPLECSGLTADKCGAVPNGCGGVLDAQADCGRPACPDGQTCANNACCAPFKTCEEALGEHQTCHPSAPDGCGGTLDCSGGCEPIQGRASSCRWVTDKWADEGGYYSCSLACSTNADCPGWKGTCTGESTWDGCGWTCSEGTCLGMCTAGDCADQEKVCRDGTCVEN